jgi:lipopolysaccharide/colanic/teichoic acid biosynthesis glycosyltransferase
MFLPTQSTSAEIAPSMSAPALVHLINDGHREPSPWSISSAKRWCDLTLALMALAISTPLFLLASILVLTSRGPLFFGSIRVGEGGKRIRVLKFRTMLHRRELGVQLTRGDDERITPAGRWLRKWKLDELPQFINVVRGEMSLVGPRPDSPEHIATLPGSVQGFLFRLKPGITSIASSRFRDEARILARVPEADLTSYYTRTLLPHKLSLDLEYASQATFLSDFILLIRTAVAVLR